MMNYDQLISNMGGCKATENNTLIVRAATIDPSVAIGKDGCLHVQSIGKHSQIENGVQITSPDAFRFDHLTVIGAANFIGEGATIKGYSFKTDDNVHIGPKTYIQGSGIIRSFAYIMTGVKMGVACDIGSGARIEDEVVIKNEVTVGPGSHISPSVYLGSKCKVGPKNQIGRKVLFENGITTAESVTIGANSVVFSRVPKPAEIPAGFIAPPNSIVLVGATATTLHCVQADATVIKYMRSNYFNWINERVVANTRIHKLEVSLSDSSDSGEFEIGSALNHRGSGRAPAYEMD